MNDDFLHQLRTRPSLLFATTLKAKLDLQEAATASRKRILYLLSLIAIGGTALAFVSPSVRETLRENVVYFGTTAATPSQSPKAPIVRQQTAAPNARFNSARSTLLPVANPNSTTNSSIPTPTHTAAEPVTDPFQNRNDLVIVANQPAPNRTYAPYSIDTAMSKAEGHVRVDGSSAAFLILETAMEEFQILTKGKVRGTVGISGTGGGIKKFCRGQLDIASTTRPIAKEEMAECAAAGIKYIEVPLAHDALVVIVSPTVTWTDQITVADLKTMWQPATQRAVTRWSQVNVRWPDQPLKLVGPPSSAASFSPAFDFFTEVVVGRARLVRNDYLTVEDPSAVAQSVNETQNALAYMSYAYYASHSRGLKALRIVNNTDEPILPLDSTIRNATYNPLSRPLFIYVNAESAKRSEVKAFVNFLLANSAMLVSEANYLPLAPDTYQIASQRFASNKLGTVFGGTSAIGVRLDVAFEREGEL